MLRFLALLLFCSSAFACSSYDTLRAARITTYADSAQHGGVWIIGDSHVERLSMAYQQGAQASGGVPFYFSGIAGATWAKLRDCIPWTAIAATHPSRIILMAGINDAATGSCCNAYGDGTLAYANTIMDTVTLAREITPDVVLATDPPPEQSAGIEPYFVHQSARVVYYVATIDWTVFGWHSTPGPFPFVDQYGAMGVGGNPASLAYAGGRYAPAGSTLDNVHFPQEGSASILRNLQ